MKFLVAVNGASEEMRERWAAAGEPVVPNFPVGAPNTFLGVNSYKPAVEAKVAEVPGLDIDILAKQLKGQYPGLPGVMLETYILETAIAAQRLHDGRRLLIFVDDDTAKLKVVELEEYYTLWTRQPIDGRIGVNEEGRSS